MAEMLPQICNSSPSHNVLKMAIAHLHYIILSNFIETGQNVHQNIKTHLISKYKLLFDKLVSKWNSYNKFFIY